jgi:UDP-N-acetyl-D-mannosaminuronate dehydrogenase
MLAINDKKRRMQTMNLYNAQPLNGKDKKILIIGLGQIGSSNAEYLSSLRLNVDGFDISEKAMQRALDAGIIKNKATNFMNYDYYIICISTHRPDNMFMPFLDGLFDITRKLSVEGKTGALVGIDSTIAKGTSRKVLEILKHRLHVVHVPHRFYINEKAEHGVKQTRVLGGCEPCCVNEGAHFYHDMLEIPLHNVKNIEIAELTKVVENSYRYMEIAFAEELKIVCDNSNIDFDELRKSINTKCNIKILEAKEGIGGHCLPKDSQMFLDFSKNSVPHSLLEAAKMIDLRYRSHVMLSPTIASATGHGSNNGELAINLPIEIVSSLKKEFNITETEIQSFVAALINKIVMARPDELKSVISSRLKTNN